MIAWPWNLTQPKRADTLAYRRALRTLTREKNTAEFWAEQSPSSNARWYELGKLAGFRRALEIVQSMDTPRRPR